MRNIQRLGSSSQFDRNYIQNLIRWKQQYPKGVSDVWMATSYGFPPLEKHRENAQKLGEIAEELRAAGIGVSLQLSNSIGHGQYMSSEDCSGLVYAGSPVRKMVGHNGTVADYCFCWRGAAFRQYLSEELRHYAREIQPDYLWIDDDFRADNHNPVRFGCYCPECMAEFNRQNGTAYTREELVEKMLHGELAIRKAFIGFLREGLGSLMEEMCRVVHEVSPNTAFGLQSSYHNYSGGDWTCAFEPMKRYSGKAPGFRSGGGVYNDHNPNDMVDKAHSLSMQNSMLPEYVTERIPEIENLPFTAFGKSASGTALEAALDLATGHTGLSFSMMMRYEEEPAFYEEFFRLFDRMGDYFDRLSKVSENSFGGGLSHLLSKQDYLKPLAPADDMEKLNDIHYKGPAPLLRDAIPMTFDTPAGATLLLHGETVRSLSEDEINRMLAGRVMMDGEAVLQLKLRGYDLGLDPKPIDPQTMLWCYEQYTDDELNKGGYLSKFQASYFVTKGCTPYAFAARPSGARVLGTYGMKQGSAALGDSTVILHTPSGGTVAALGYVLCTAIVPVTQRDRILRIADAIGAHPLPARVVTAHQAFLYPRIAKKDGKTLAVSLVNATVGPEEMTLAIRNPACTQFTWMSQYGETQTLSYTQENGEYILSLPALAAYSMGTVFCEGEAMQG